MSERNWRSSLLSPDAKIVDAVRAIDKSEMKAGVVTDPDGILLGIVTDGDIRRGLLKGFTMQDSITSILNVNPTVAKKNTTREARIKLLESKQLVSLPVIDERNKVIGVDLLTDLIKTNNYDNPVFLMAGGFGKRLRPLTNSLPKPMLELGGKPILERILESFVKCGFKNFYMSIHYMPEKIREYFGNGEKWGVHISYLTEEIPLGTAGALGLLPVDQLDLPLIVMNADLLTKVNFENLLEFHMHSKALATVAVREYDFQVPYGVLHHQQGRITEIVEKPVQQFFVNAGIYVLDPLVYKSVSRNGETLDMPCLLNRFIQEQQEVTMFLIHEYWLDIGKINDFEKAQKEFSTLNFK